MLSNPFFASSLCLEAAANDSKFKVCIVPSVLSANATQPVCPCGSKGYDGGTSCLAGHEQACMLKLWSLQITRMNEQPSFSKFLEIKQV